ncbi:hypothetical protein [Mycobacteroides abscessus]|nr:hypothetical protein [Mycobacteroides abscessus]MDO3333929.1 hypothetical protein [Mycobacteroides abscessus subsp. bolletii]QSM86861.1 hypothetical protein I3U44_13160 [Mycobacteroides abscessus subsp. bolletii]
MTTKLFKRASTKDVFDTVADEAPVDDAPEMEPEPEPDDAVDAASKDGLAEDAPEYAGEAQLTRRIAMGVVAMVLVAALSVSGFLYWQSLQRKEIDQASAAALSSAEQFAVALTSMDSGKVDDNFNQVVSNATGSFKDAYTQSASQLRQVLIDNKAASKGTVIDSAVKSATKDEVQVLLFVDQWITNAANPQPRLDRSRVAVTMHLIDGRWLASDVELK